MILSFIGMLIWVFMKDYEEAQQVVDGLMVYVKIEAFCESLIPIGILVYLILK